MAEFIGALGDEPLDWRIKGAPVLPPGTTVAEFVKGSPGLFEAGFVPPIMVLKESAVASNVATLRDFCASVHADLAPHGKTHMSPQLAHRQIEAGAWGITVATPSQARVFRAGGVQRIFMANELVDPAGVAWVVREQDADPDFTFLTYVDSVAGVEILGRAVEAAGGDRPLDVLVEVGPPTRTGARSADEALAVARAAAAQSRLRLRGVSGYEGTIGHRHEPAEDTDPQVRSFLELLRAAGEQIAPLVSADAGFVVSAGGSVYFDVAAEILGRPWSIGRPVQLILRSGAYITHDSGGYLRQTPFGRELDGKLLAAFELWAPVVSRPEPGKAYVCAGKRDLPYDIDLPFAQAYRASDGAITPLAGVEVTAMNDQHGHLAFTGEQPFAVGDWIRFGVSHPCTTFDKWQWIPVVDDDYRVVDYIRTFF
jgi:D-serine deaminase-like pyridoxal phosphate-dependent protein